LKYLQLLGVTVSVNGSVTSLTLQTNTITIQT